MDDKHIAKGHTTLPMRGAQTSFSEGHCLLSWGVVTLPKINGGLGITDLKFQNRALITRWLWLAVTEAKSLWASTLSNNQ
jgi:hypothetical protein